MKKKKDKKDAAEEPVKKKGKGFLKKKAKPEADDDGGGVEKSSDKEPSFVGRNKREHVLFESSFSAAMDLFRKNKLFCVNRGSMPVWIGARLDLDEIGGLTAKDKRDESKGQIINLINSGKISSLFTPVLEAENAIIFIPDKDTVHYMSEFSLLGDHAKYELVILDHRSEGAYERTNIFTTLTSLEALHNSNRSVDTLEGMDEVLAEVQIKDEREASLDYIPEEMTPTEHDMSEQRPEEDNEMVSRVELRKGSDVGKKAEDAAKEQKRVVASAEIEKLIADSEEVEEESYDDEQAGYDDGYEGGLMQPVPVMMEEEPVYVSEEEAQALINRKFFNEDLSIELDSSGLDQALEPNMSLALPVEPSSWLNDQYNHMVATANEDLLSLHNMNMNAVRQSYLDAMVDAYNNEMANVLDIEQDPRYASVMAEAEQLSQGKQDRIIAEQRQLEDDYQAAMKAAGESARKTAEEAYRDRYKVMHEEAMRNIATEADAATRAAIESLQDKLRTVRKKEAQARLDQIHDQEIQKALAMYKQLAESEQAMYRDYVDEMKDFLDKYRTEEFARSKVLEKELRESDRVESLQRDYDHRVKMLEEDMQGRLDRAKADLEEMEARHKTAMAAKDNDAAYAAEQHAQVVASKDSRIDGLLEDFAKLDETKEARVAGQVAELQARSESLEQKYRDAVESGRRQGRLMVGITIAACVATLLIGAVGGQFLFKSDPAPVQNDVQAGYYQTDDRGLSDERESDSRESESEIKSSDADSKKDSGESEKKADSDTEKQTETKLAEDPEKDGE